MPRGLTMDIAELAQHGIDARMVAMWSDGGMKTLLPVQAEAVRKGKVLEGGNVVVFSPTSSGKTFVGELAAARVACNMDRVVYLAPQKALAEEKFREFHAKYGGFGIRVVISTRDRKEFDRDIQGGKFHIAVIVFEKMQTLLVGNPDLLAGLGLVVIDELQMLGDEGRGAGLELLLTKLLQVKNGPQLVGLSAVLGNAKSLADWLGATLCAEEARPVELRKGVLYNGEFHYLEQNSRREGREALADPIPVPGSTEELPGLSLLEAVAALVERGEQCLVFRKSRNDTMEAARAIAERIGGAPCPQALERMDYQEDSQGKTELMALLNAGVAFHNADLDWEQRRIIESCFRSGEIRVVCATSTLALGMNLPCRNVFLDHEKWTGGAGRRMITKPLTQAEYENISGRGGRLGFDADFGRAVLTAETPLQQDILFGKYVRGRLEDLRPMLDDAPLSWHVLNLVASNLCRRRREIHNILLGSYTGRMIWRRDRPAFEERVEEAIAECLDGQLMVESAGTLRTTKAGKHAATKGIDVDTAVALMEFLRTRKGCQGACSALEVLWALAGTPYSTDRVYLTVRKEEVNDRRYRHRLDDVIASLPPEAGARMEAESSSVGDVWDFAKQAKKTLLMLDWISGVPNRDIEDFFNCYHGNAATLGSEFSWLAETLAGLAQATGWPDAEVRKFAELSPRLLYGVGNEGVGLASLRLPGLARGRVKALVDRGWATLEQLIAAPVEAVRKLVTQNVASRLLPMARRRHERLLAGDIDVADAFDEFMPAAEEAVPETWAQTYPASDAEGVEYQSGAQIQIVGVAGQSGGDDDGEYRTCATVKLIGRAKTKKHLVIIDRNEYWLSERLFGVMLSLAVSARCSDLGWAGANELGGETDACYQSIRRLKQLLKKQGMGNADALVENNKCKQYRLSTPPRNIEIDEDSVSRHFPEGKTTIRRLRRCREAVGTSP